MANKTLLRRYAPSGLLLLLYRQSSSAKRHLCMEKLLHLHRHQQLHGLPRLQQPAPSASPMSSVSAKHSTLHCLPAVPERHSCFPLLSASSSCSFGAGDADIDLRGDCSSDAIAGLQLPPGRHDHSDLLLIGDGRRKPPMAVRSSSLSKLQCNRSHAALSLKSLLRWAHSHGLLQRPNHHSRSSSLIKRNANESWSSADLRHTKEAAGASCSFHGELTDSEGSRCGKGKRAPKGHVAVYVEGGKERRVVPIAYLSHPCFEELLRRAEMEYGYAQKGGLLLPCSLAELGDHLNRILLDGRNHHRHTQSHNNSPQ